MKWLNEINGNNGRFEGARVGSNGRITRGAGCGMRGILLPAGSACFRQAFWTYIVDDDIVINGWYFLDGEPKLYVRDTPDTSSVAWGSKSDEQI